MSEIQAVLFDKNMWTTKSAKKELTKMALTPMKRVHTTDKHYRYKITDPSLYNRLRTKHTNRGITLIIGYKK